MAFQSSWQNNYIFIKAGHKASGMDILETINSLSKDPRFDSSFNQVWDFSETIEFSLNTADLKEFNKFAHEHCVVDESACFAMVAPNPSVYFRLQAIISFTEAGNCRSKVFHNEDDAKHWIDTMCLQRISLN